MSTIDNKVVWTTDELSAVVRYVTSDANRNEHFLILNGRRRTGVRELADAIHSTRGLAADFDGTVTDGIQWESMRRHMSEELRTDDLAEVAAYFRGERTDEGDVAFLIRSIGRLAACGLTQEQFRAEAACQSPRQGARELFQTYGGATAIVSYGTETFIAEWARAHAVPVGETYAARLTWALANGGYVLTGCERESIVVEATKGLARERFSRRCGILDREVLILEDTPSMLARMMSPRNVGVLMLPRNDPYANRREERLRQLRETGMFEKFDAILVSDSLWPLVRCRSGNLF